jgi:hypothetical protein
MTSPGEAGHDNFMGKMQPDPFRDTCLEEVVGPLGED